MALLPTSLQAITLAEWIDYTNSLKPLDEWLKSLLELPDGQRKEILLTRNYVDRAYHTYEWFGGTEAPLVDDVLQEYTNSFCRILEQKDGMICGNFDLGGHQWTIPIPELTETSDITFGQFIDAKMLTQGATDADSNKWELLRYVCAIFIRRGNEAYDPMYVSEGNEKYQLCGSIPMPIVASMSDWFDAFNTYIHDNYTLFQDSGEPEKANMKEHMRRWGWVNFLKSVAKTKVFDISGSGLNSIDCARLAKCADVLVWASEEKDYNIALQRDMEQ